MPGLSSAAPSVLRTFPTFTNFFFNHQSAQMNTKKHPCPSGKFDSLAPTPFRPSGQPLVDVDSRLPMASHPAGNLRQFDSQDFQPCSFFGAALRQSFSANPSASIPVRPPSRLGLPTGPDAWLWLDSHQSRRARSLLKNSYTDVFKLAAIF